MRELLRAVLMVLCLDWGEDFRVYDLGLRFWGFNLGQELDSNGGLQRMTGMGYKDYENKLHRDWIRVGVFLHRVVPPC